MAKHLTKSLLLLTLLYQQAVFADVLVDPTMPPAGFEQTALGQGAATTIPVISGPTLQSVTLGTEKKFAMISGKTVMLGQRYESYQLVELKADEVKLRGLDGTFLVLKMDFKVEKKPLFVSEQQHGNRHAY